MPCSKVYLHLHMQVHIHCALYVFCLQLLLQASNTSARLETILHRYEVQCHKPYTQAEYFPTNLFGVVLPTLQLKKCACMFHKIFGLTLSKSLPRRLQGFFAESTSAFIYSAHAQEYAIFSHPPFEQRFQTWKQVYPPRKREGGARFGQAGEGPCYKLGKCGRKERWQGKRRRKKKDGAEKRESLLVRTAFRGAISRWKGKKRRRYSFSFLLPSFRRPRSEGVSFAAAAFCSSGAGWKERRG